MRQHHSTSHPIARMPAPRLLGVLAASAALAATAGCTSTSEGAGSTTITVAAPTSGSAGTPEKGVVSPSASTSASVPSAAPLPVVGTRRGSAIDNAVVDVTLNSVVVNAAMMTVTWTARNAGEQPWRVADYFFAGYYFDAAAPDNGLDAPLAKGKARADGQADGVYVLDRTKARRYLTGRDKSTRCACSSGLAMANLEPGGEAVLEAQYKAPPADVTTVDVVVPNVGSFRDVTVTR